MDYIIEIDTWLMLAINGFNHEYVDPFMKAFSGRFPWIFLYIAIAGAMWWKYGWRRALVMVAATGIAVGISDFVCASLIRSAVQRLRPSNLDNEISALVHVVNEYRSGSYGFPSCHACNTFALAVASSLFIRDSKYTAFILIWAILQCYSRVYLGVHYPGDILVGAIIGSLFSYMIYCLAKRFVLNRLSSDNVNPRSNAWPPIVLGVIVTAILAAVSLIKLFA